jgi:tryptophanyl-tRNA synthetase
MHGTDLLTSLRIEIEQLAEKEQTKVANLLEQLNELELGIKELSSDKTDEDEITPYKVASKGAIQYEVFREKWGLKSIDSPLIERIERITGKKVHTWIRRQIFYCHVDLDKFLDEYEKGTPCYLYTGRGPSSESMTVAHLLPFRITQWFQEAFNIPVIIQMSDDEKVYAKDHLDHENAYRLTLENAKDIIAAGFNPDKTWIFSNMKTVGGEYYVNVGKIFKITTLSTVKGIFGFDNSINMGMYSWFAFQEAPAFSSSFPDIFNDKHAYCLVPMAIDQTPFFRHVRDIAGHKSLKEWKPAIIACKFFPSLNGVGGKMDSSGKVPAVFLTDTAPRIKKAIAGAVSGGAETLEQQLKEGSDLEADIPYQWLRFFLDDDEELEKIAKAYGKPEVNSKTFCPCGPSCSCDPCTCATDTDTSNRMSTGQVKQRLTEIMTEVVTNHQKTRESVTPEVLARYMTRRSLV